MGTLGKSIVKRQKLEEKVKTLRLKVEKVRLEHELWALVRAKIARKAREAKENA